MFPQFPIVWRLAINAWHIYGLLTSISLTCLIVSYFGPLLFMSWAPRCNLCRRYFADLESARASGSESVAEAVDRTIGRRSSQPASTQESRRKRANSVKRGGAGTAAAEEPRNPVDVAKEPWALVTGASSGIGLCIVRELARQGINVVLVARNDALLPKAVEQLHTEFPERSFRVVATDLSDATPADNALETEVGVIPGYLSDVKEATADLFAADTLRLVFSNAGYLLMSFYWQRGLAEQMRNWECNVTAALRLTHYVLERWAQNQHRFGDLDRTGATSRTSRRRLLVFTSSSSFFLPTPFATLYGAEKAALTSFAQSLAVEVRDLGVDVLVVHPSYTRTNLYAGQPKLAILRFLDRFTGASPEGVAESIMRSIGRGFLIRDIGLYSSLTRWLNHIIDIGLLSSILVQLRHLVPEYRAFKAASEAPRQRAC
jgi:short-subunit dehydrogenase